MRIYWFYFLISLSTVFFSTIGITLTLFDWKGKIWAIIVRYWAKSILWIVKIRYSIIGLDKLDPNQQYVFASNHESAFDIPLTLGGIPWHVVPIAKKELKRIKELKKEIPFYGELSTSESKDSESYKKLVITLKNELESLENKSVSKRKK